MIWLFLAVAMSVGFLGAVPFWDASGLPPLDDHWELVISGGIVGCPATRETAPAMEPVA